MQTSDPGDDDRGKTVTRRNLLLKPPDWTGDLANPGKAGGSSAQCQRDPDITLLRKAGIAAAAGASPATCIRNPANVFCENIQATTASPNA